MEDRFKELEQDFNKTPRTAAEGAADPPRRKRGAPPGNQNARKHGFYAKSLTPVQQAALLEAREAYLLAEELAVLRDQINAFIDNLNTNIDTDLIPRAMARRGRTVRIDNRVRFDR